MAIHLEANYSKKLGLPGYSSHQYSVTIRYQGQVARLRATRGLQCLASLLRRPGKEFHVSELIAEFVELPALNEVEGVSQLACPAQYSSVEALSSGPILDTQGWVILNPRKAGDFHPRNDMIVRDDCTAVFRRVETSF